MDFERNLRLRFPKLHCLLQSYPFIQRESQNREPYDYRLHTYTPKSRKNKDGSRENWNPA